MNIRKRKECLPSGFLPLQSWMSSTNNGPDSPQAGEAGTNLSYCNGEIGAGSSNITLYIVWPYARPRQIAQTLQQTPGLRAWKKRRGKSREQHNRIAGDRRKQWRIFRSAFHAIFPRAATGQEARLPNLSQGVQATSMPELPDVSAYITALEPRILGQPLQHVRIASAFLLRTVQPPLASVEGRPVRELRRVGKRIALGLEGDLWLALHLMIAGRLYWRAPQAKLAGRQTLAAFDFPAGSLVLTEAGAKRRASLHVISGEENLRSLDAGGIDVLSSDLDLFRTTLTAENHTLKRALTDPRLLSGIGNAYSDEILHAARLSPLTLTQKLQPHEWERLFAATRHTLQFWIDQLGAEAKTTFPEKVTAFRKGMAVHGRYGEPCFRCGDKVLRIRYADKETNYCARCQTGGKVLADRSLSRLLGSDWPRTLEELEALKRR